MVHKKAHAGELISELEASIQNTQVRSELVGSKSFTYYFKVQVQTNLVEINPALLDTEIGLLQHLSARRGSNERLHSMKQQTNLK